MSTLSSETHECYVAGCGDTVHQRLMCSKHYSRWRRHGDPTITKPPASGKGKPRPARHL